MSEKQPVGIGSFIRKGSKVTPEQLLDKYIGDVKEFTTEINNPVDMTIVESLSYLNRQRGIVPLADFYDNLCDRFRVNMIANRRQRSKEFSEALVAVMVEENRKLAGETGVSSLIKKKGRR